MGRYTRGQFAWQARLDRILLPPAPRLPHVCTPPLPEYPAGRYVCPVCGQAWEHAGPQGGE